MDKEEIDARRSAYDALNHHLEVRSVVKIPADPSCQEAVGIVFHVWLRSWAEMRDRHTKVRCSTPRLTREFRRGLIHMGRTRTRALNITSDHLLRTGGAARVDPIDQSEIEFINGVFKEVLGSRHLSRSKRTTILRWRAAFQLYVSHATATEAPPEPVSS